MEATDPLRSPNIRDRPSASDNDRPQTSRGIRRSRENMEQNDLSEQQQQPLKGLARSKKGALGRVWQKLDAGLIGKDKAPSLGTSTAPRSQVPYFQLQSQLSPLRINQSASTNSEMQNYGRRVLPPREAHPTTPTTPRTPIPLSNLSPANDYIPRLPTSINRDPHPAPVQRDAVPLPDDFMMNISPLFADNAYGFVEHQEADEGLHMDHDSPAQQPQRVSPSMSRPSVDRPSPRSNPYPRPAPVSEHARGGISSGGESGVSNEGRRRIFIEPRGNRFKPAKHGINIGFQCMAKHWVAGWTTISTCEQWAKDQWFEEFKALATWDEQYTPIIQSIFFEKCRNKLGNGWWNLRHARTAEGLKFLKRHEVDQGFVRYIENSELIEKMSVRNKENSKAIEARLHVGGAKSADVHFEELTASLGRVVCCHEMYDKLRKKPDESYVSVDAAEKAQKLKAAHDTLKVKYDGQVPQAVDFEVGADIIGTNIRTGLPLIIASAATLVEGSKYQRLANLRTASYEPSSSTQLAALSQQVTQLQQNHEQMMDFQQKQQEIILNLTQALLKATSSQPPNRNEDEEIV
ncbi:unnamed protein product [Rhodiola kirilowii]